MAEPTVEKNLYILTEERPKEEVVDFIVNRYANDTSSKFKIGKIKFNPTIKNQKFCFKWEIKGVKIEGIGKIIVENVSGTSSFVDFLVFDGNQDPNPETDKPLYAIEETKTTPSESRNVSVFQRMTKFVFIEQYPSMKDSEKIMLYTIRRPYYTYPDTFEFGLKTLKTLGVSSVFLQDRQQPGLNVNDGKLSEPGFKDFDEFMESKNKIASDSDSDIPIKIKKEKIKNDKLEKISISAKLEKSGGFSNDPNIGAVSGLSFLSKKLCGSIKEIVITNHCCDGYTNPKTHTQVASIKDKVERSKGKFVKICTALEKNFGVKISLDGIEIPKADLDPEYWHKELNGEKLATIFLHLGLLGTNDYEVIYEQHAGTERGYFVTPVYFGINTKNNPALFETFQEYMIQNTIDEKEFKKVLKVENGLLELPKDKKSKAIFGSDTSEETFHIPDLILLDPENKEILMVEGEKAENVNKPEKGVNQLPLFDDLENFFLKEYYPKYDVKRFVVLYGDEELDDMKMKDSAKDKVIFQLNTDGTMITYDKCPQRIKDVINKLEK